MTQTEIIQKYSKMIYALALSRTRQQSDADDVFQEVFLKYLEKNPKFLNETHLKAWLIKVTINITKDFYKEAYVTKRVDYDEETLENVPSDRDFLAELENEAVFEERISEISPRARTVMLLRFDGGYKIREIAKLLGESENTVKALLARGKRQYRNLVMKGEQNDEQKEA